MALLIFGGRMFPLQPLILPGGFDIPLWKLVVIFKIILVGLVIDANFSQRFSSNFAYQLQDKLFQQSVYLR